MSVDEGNLANARIGMSAERKMPTVGHRREPGAAEIDIGAEVEIGRKWGDMDDEPLSAACAFRWGQRSMSSGLQPSRHGGREKRQDASKSIDSLSVEGGQKEHAPGRRDGKRSARVG